LDELIIQSYTASALAIAGIVTRGQDNLSYLDETVVLHLLALVSCGTLVGTFIIQEAPSAVIANFSSTHKSRPPPSEGLFPPLTKIKAGASSILSSLRFMIWAFAPLLLSAIATLDKDCRATTDQPYSGYENITWIFIFAIRLHGNSINISRCVFPFLAGTFIVLSSFLVEPYLSAKLREYHSYSIAIWFFLFWFEEVVAIERSLVVNKGLDIDLISTWGFGQVRTHKSNWYLIFLTVNSPNSVFTQIIAIILQGPLLLKTLRLIDDCLNKAKRRSDEDIVLPVRGKWLSSDHLDH
jgi:hypothetical protein